MFKKILTGGLLATLALFALPATANAASYGDTGDGTGTSVTVAPGEVATFAFTGFQPGENTTASAPDAVTLGAIKVVSSASRPAAADGSVKYSVSATEPGSYTITVSSASHIATGLLTIVPADGAAKVGAKDTGSLPNTGAQVNTLVIWGASGVLLLGVALLFVLNVVRKNGKKPSSPLS